MMTGNESTVGQGSSGLRFQPRLREGGPAGVTNHPPEPHSPVKAYVALVVSTVAFGGTFVATKVALRGFEPLLIALLRFTVAGTILWLVWRLRGEREAVSRRELPRLALLGFVSLTVYFTFENLGIARTSASAAAILIATIPIFVLVLNALTVREHTAVSQWLGVALSFSGVAALVSLGARGAGGATLSGDLLVLTASLSGAIYTVMARRLLVTRSALFVTTFQNLFGALFMAPLAAVEAAVVGVKKPTTAAAGAMLYLALLGSIVAYLLLNYGLRFVPAGRASAFTNLVPVIAVGVAFVVLGERFTVAQALAAVVVVAGVFLANRTAPLRG
jgi:drug/metabolite transporter (DMT)-like permease